MRSMNKILDEWWENKTLEERKECNRKVYGHECPDVGIALSRAKDAKKEMDKYFRLMMQPVVGVQYEGLYHRWKERYEENIEYYERMKDCKLIC